jgi:hypothetical protein
MMVKEGRYSPILGAESASRREKVLFFHEKRDEMTAGHREGGLTARKTAAAR